MAETDLTVAVVIERDGRFLIVEETSRGRLVLTQPGGHIETGETPEEAARREVCEETGLDVVIREPVGAYLWQDETGGREFLRIVFTGDCIGYCAPHDIDPAIHGVHWLRYEELAAARARWRSPSVMRCIDDYLAGERQPKSLFAGLEHPEHQLEMALASAEFLPA